MQIAIVGGGYVGVTTATTIAERGHSVTLVEQDAGRRAALGRGHVPFHEPGLEAALVAQRSRIATAAQIADAPEPDGIIICVGTPSLADGRCDTTALEASVSQIKRARGAWRASPFVAVKSTVAPGTTRRHVAKELEGWLVAMVPEFLREGTALSDARTPDRTVIGTTDGAPDERLAAAFDVPGVPTLWATFEDAELCKYAANAMLALRVAFANEIASITERFGGDINQVMQAVGLDGRIGPAFLEPGPGFGGSCFPKDVRALAALARQGAITTPLLSAVLQSNDEQPHRIVAAAKKLLDPLSGRTIAILGVAFKAETSDVRETRALPIIESLIDAGATVRCHDPAALHEFAAICPRGVTLHHDVKDALMGADLAILHTPWPMYRDLTPQRLLDLMATAYVLDTRRFLDAGRLRSAGVRLHAYGVADDPPAAPLPPTPQTNHR